MFQVRVGLAAGMLLLLAGCGVSQSEHDKLKAENDTLKAENLTLKQETDRLKNGAERLAVQAEKAYQAKDYTTAKRAINSLATHHPESPLNIQFAQYLKVIEVAEQHAQAQRAAKEAQRIAEEKQAQAKRDAEEKERKRLANLNNTGTWRVGHYVDEFGSPTAASYVTNRSPIIGTFSNSATQDSPLRVIFLINSKTDVAIQLYEYAGDNPVKSSRGEAYKVAVQDSNGEKYYYTAKNWSDRISLDLDSNDSLYKAFLKGGTVKFRVIEEDNSTTNYAFDIVADGYENAIRILTEANRPKAKNMSKPQQQPIR